MKLSVCMIVKNEEDCLERSLSSIKDLADEIIIVDTGSTDKTKEIAAKFTSNIIDFSWINDFSAARNESLKHASGDWILVLDADEYIEDITSIKEALISAKEGTSAFWFARDNKNTEDTNLSKTDSIVRLFRNDKNILFEGVVHEVVTNSAKKVGKIEPCSSIIHHEGGLTRNAEEKTKIYEKLAKKKIKQQQDYHSYWELGRDYLNQGKTKEAIALLKQSVSKKHDYFPALVMLGNAYLKQNDSVNARKYFSKAHPLGSHYFLHYGEAVILTNEEKYEEALKELFKSIELSPKTAAIHFQIGVCFDKLNRLEKARTAFENAIELDPKYESMISLEK